MPVEIRELVIRAVIAPGEGSNASASEGDDTADNQQDALVQACVRQVLDILKKEKER